MRKQQYLTFTLFLLMLSSAYAITFDLNQAFDVSSTTKEVIVWRMGDGADGTTIYDVSNSDTDDHNLAKSAGSTYVAGIYGNALDGNSFDNQLSISGELDNIWNYGHTGFGFWWKWAGGTDGMNFYGFNYEYGDDWNFNTFNSVDDHFSFSVTANGFGGSGFQCVANNLVVKDGNWHHYVMAVDDGDQHIEWYRDGVLIDTDDTGTCDYEDLGGVGVWLDYWSSLVWPFGNTNEIHHVDWQITDDFVWFQNEPSISFVPLVVSDPPTWDESVDNTTIDLTQTLTWTGNWTTSATDSFASTNLSGATFTTDNGTQTAAFSWTPTTAGTYYYTYNIENDDGSDNRTAYVTVTPDPPTWDEAHAPATLLTGQTYQWTGNWTTLTTDSNAYTDLPGASTNTDNGTQTTTFTWTPSAAGSYPYNYSVTNQYGTDTQSNTYTVYDAPTWDTQAGAYTSFVTNQYYEDSAEDTLYYTASNDVTVTVNDSRVNWTKDDTADTVYVFFNTSEPTYYEFSLTISNAEGSDTTYGSYSAQYFDECNGDETCQTTKGMGVGTGQFLNEMSPGATGLMSDLVFLGILALVALTAVGGVGLGIQKLLSK